MNDTDKRAIEEMASDIEQSGMLDSRSRCRIVAEELYTKGYRKQSEGEWVERIEPLTWCEDDADVFYECSCCGTQSHGQSPYCPNCGARMGGGAE